MQTLKIKDVFKRVEVKQKEEISRCNDGIYPLIGQSGSNNGVVKYIDHYEFDLDYPVITVSSVGGITFKQQGKFSLTGGIHLLKFRPEYKYLESYASIVAFILNSKFTKKYSYAIQANANRLAEEEFEIPNPMNYEWIYTHFL